MEAVEDKVRLIISDICRNRSIILYKVDMQGGFKNRQIRVTVDTEAGITINECKKLGAEIQDMFFRKDIFPDGYNIEVGSPGVDKALEHPFEYKRNIGRDISVDYENAEKIEHAVGKLAVYEENKLTLMVGKNTVEIPVNAIRQAKVKLKW